MANNVKIKLIKSKIGCTKSQIATLEALGLNKIGQEKSFKDNPCFRGQVLKIQHLLKVQLEG